ncbi:MAG: hypothetical protein AAF629_22745, partial [Chloroflexota bacterium]
MKICTICCNDNIDVGVAIEARKWEKYYQMMGFELFYCRGELEVSQNNSKTLLLPEIYFHYPANKALREMLYHEQFDFDAFQTAAV